MIVARRDDLIDPVQHVARELDLRGGELGLEMAQRARADDRRGHRRMIEHERERERDQRVTGLLGQLRELFDGFELALIGRVGQVEACGGAG